MNYDYMSHKWKRFRNEAPKPKLLREVSAQDSGTLYEQTLMEAIRKRLGRRRFTSAPLEKLNNPKVIPDYFFAAAGFGSASDVELYYGGQSKKRGKKICSIETKTSMKSDHGQFRIIYDLKKQEYTLNRFKGTDYYDKDDPATRAWKDNLWNTYIGPVLNQQGSGWPPLDPLMVILGADAFSWNKEEPDFDVTVDLGDESAWANVPAEARAWTANLPKQDMSAWTFTLPSRYIGGLQLAHRKVGGDWICKGAVCQHLGDWFDSYNVVLTEVRAVMKSYLFNAMDQALDLNVSAERIPTLFKDVAGKYVQKGDTWIQSGDIGFYALKSSAANVGGTTVPMWNPDDEDLARQMRPDIRLYIKRSGSSRADGGALAFNSAIKFAGMPKPQSPINLLPIPDPRKPMIYGAPQLDELINWVADKLCKSSDIDCE